MGRVDEPSRPTETVLLVDDDGLVRMFGADILEDAGFIVLGAENADAALQTLEAQANSVTVLVTDVHMPGSMDGHELARVVYERWPWIKIVITSGRALMAPRDIPDHGLIADAQAQEDRRRSELDFGPLGWPAEDCDHTADEIGVAFRNIDHFR